jgi:hypothetical protein
MMTMTNTFSTKLKVDHFCYEFQSLQGSNSCAPLSKNQGRQNTPGVMIPDLPKVPTPTFS